MNKRASKRSRNYIYLVTHDQEEALTMSDKIVVMNQGEIQQVDLLKIFTTNQLTAL